MKRFAFALAGVSVLLLAALFVVSLPETAEATDYCDVWAKCKQSAPFACADAPDWGACVANIEAQCDYYYGPLCTGPSVGGLQ